MPQARKTDKQSGPPSAIAKRLREGGLLVLIAIAIFLFAALLSYDPQDPSVNHHGPTGDIQNWGGRVGATLADGGFYLLGFCAFVFPLLVVQGGWRAFRQRETDLGLQGPVYLILRAVGFILTLLAGAALARMFLQRLAEGFLPATAGGVVGDLLAGAAEGRFGFGGAALLLLAVFLAGITLATGLSWLALVDGIGRIVLETVRGIANNFAGWREKRKVEKQKKVRKEVVKKEIKKVKERKERKPVKIEPVISEPEPPSPRAEREQQRAKQRPLFKDIAPGELPPLDLLDDPPESHGGYSEEALDAMARLVEIKLADFGIQVEVVAVNQGPVITRFELQLAPGVKVSRITALSKDLARALSTVSVRVVEVIPGKPVVGLEIPNEQRDVISLSEILRSKAYDKAKSPMTMALGKNISGRPVVADLAKMPHLLVAGTTGSGKSVAVNAMILSILYKAQPEDVRLILIDPKMLELSVYEGIRHLLTPVVTDMADASNALRWCVAEMEQRYKLMSAMGVRNMAGFNKKVADAKKAGEPLTDPLYRPPPPLTIDDETPPPPAPELEHMPYIVVVIDELADLMMIVGKKVEQLIARLAQKARAAGIHLILATQRPSVDVITGLIKANIPTRIAFQVSAKVDSRTILDQMGAEALLGRGDMLYMPPGTSIPERVHGAFVDDHEVHHVVEFLKQQGEPDYVEEITNESSDPVLPTEFAQAQADADRGSAESDPLYDQAVRIVTESRKASISSVQRRLQVGYNRAARMIEQMEAAGIVTPPQNNGSREVIAPAPPED